MNFKPLTIGDISIKLPLIQGGMGVGVSLSGLASAVSNEGGLGVLSAAHIGYKEPLFEKDAIKANLEAIASQIKIAKEKAKDKFIGINIMTASRRYDDYVLEAVKNKIDLIISGAGLPVNLPKLVEDSKTKIAPIVSSLKACNVLLGLWEKRYNASADLIVVEGPKAGGHLGFKYEYLENEAENFDTELEKIIEFKKGYEKKHNKKIPLVFAGGVFSAEDIKHYLDMGADGVQIASRFVATEECDAHINFKQAYVNSKKEDMVIVKSPVGMPGRALMNDFVKRTMIKKEPIEKCYTCLAKCDRDNIPFCITNALIKSVKGDVENGLIFAGANTYKIDKISTVKDIIKELFEID